MKSVYSLYADFVHVSITKLFLPGKVAVFNSDLKPVYVKRVFHKLGSFSINNWTAAQF